MSRSRSARVTLTLGVGCAIAVLWLALAPTTLGGSASYVTTHGISMLPRFHTGDLAIVRRQSSYQVGDVAAYHSPALRTVVMHRIVAINHGRYTFKGDNNSWLDPGPVTRSQLIGALTLRVPQGGIWLARLASPPALAILAFLLLISGGSAATARRRRRRRAVASHTSPRPRARATLGTALGALPGPLRAAAVAAAVTGALGAVLAALAWTRPATVATTTRAEPIHRSVSFSYSAHVAPSPAYDSTTVTSPEPIFRALTNTLTVHYTYRGTPATLTTAADLSTDSGWHTSIPLAGPTRVGAGPVHAGVPLDLKALETRAQAAAKITGMPANQILVAVTVTVHTRDGVLFAPSLRLALTPLQATLIGSPTGLLTTNTTTATHTIAEPGTLNLFGRHLAISTARTASLAALLLTLLAAIAITTLARLHAPTTEAGRIRRRHATLLLPVQPIPSPPGHPVVDVAEFKALVRLAERYGLLILHWARADVHTFVVHDDTTTYRYRTPDSNAETPDQPHDNQILSGNPIGSVQATE